MRKLVTVGLLSALLASVVVASASAAVKKPKPWQWTPQKVVLKLTASKPISAAGLGRTSCRLAARPRGGVSRAGTRGSRATRGMAGRTGSETTVLSVRVLPVGTGKLCIVAVTFPNLPGKFFSVDASSGKPGPWLKKPEFACPNPGVVP